MHKEIWLLRHGETDGNDSGVIQSRADYSLNGRGRRQAHLFYKAYQSTIFDGIYTSPLTRTRESVRMFLDCDNAVPHHVLDDLNDMRWGSEFIGMSLEDERFKAVRKAWIKGAKNLRTEHDGESPEDMDRRLQRAMTTIISQTDTRALVVSHSMCFRVLLSRLMHGDLTHMVNYDSDNISLYILGEGENGWSLKTTNDTSHLSSE